MPKGIPKSGINKGWFNSKRAKKYGFQKGHLVFNGCEKGQFKIGENHPNFGKHLSEEIKQKQREKRKERKEKLGYLNSPETREKIRKKSLEKKGEKASAWQGGKSFELYGMEFNDLLREQIRNRDNFRCQQCFRHQDELYDTKGRKYRLLVHHIDYNKKNNNENNLISLCRNCHTQTNFKREDWINYFKKRSKG